MLGVDFYFPCNVQPQAVVQDDCLGLYFETIFIFLLFLTILLHILLSCNIVFLYLSRWDFTSLGRMFYLSYVYILFVIGLGLLCAQGS